MENKVLLFYASRYDEIGAYTASESELLVLTPSRAVIYRDGCGYEGEDNHLASKILELNPKQNPFGAECFSHLLSSLENKENVVDCDGYDGTNEVVITAKAVDVSEVDPQILEGSLEIDLHKFSRSLKLEEIDYRIEPFAYSIAAMLPTLMWPSFIKPFAKPLSELAKGSWEKEEKVRRSSDRYNAMKLGEYPQAQAKDEAIIAKLNEAYGTPNDNEAWNDFGYRAFDYEGGYQFFIDVNLDGQKYRGLYFKEMRPKKFADNIGRNYENIQGVNGFQTNTTYWFRYEPLVWVCTQIQGEDKYICLNIVDAGPMFKGGYGDPKNEDKDLFFASSSHLLPWLKDVFVPTAFEETLQPNLQISILSAKEYEIGLPLKNHRRPRPTDYALAKGYLANYPGRGNDFPFVWTSTLLTDLNRMVSISKDGSIVDFYSENHGYINYVYGGIQPAFAYLNKTKKPTGTIDFGDLIDESVPDEEALEETGTTLDIDDDDDFPF